MLAITKEKNNKIKLFKLQYIQNKYCIRFQNYDIKMYFLKTLIHSKNILITKFRVL